MTRQCVGELVEHVEQFRKRLVQDALAEATAAYWLRRAEQFEVAMPRPGDFIGGSTPEQIEARRHRLAATALACRRRAEVSLLAKAAP